MINVQNAVDAYRANPELAQKADEQWQSLLSRSATDRAFRDTLIADPRAAIAEFTGREAPESLNVAFVENQADATIVLPPFVDPANELSEAELEAVAGGSDPVSTAIITALVLIDAALITYAILESHEKAN
jgi:hypothetical protein